MEPPRQLRILVHIAVFAVWAYGQNDREVTTANGKLRGFFNKSVTHFFAIPYAAPPVGNLRFRAPAAPSDWEGVRDAFSYAQACTQVPPSPPMKSDQDDKTPSKVPNNAPKLPGPVQSGEDCLYLDVYVPGDTDNNTGSLPVLVFIHGGAFMIGSSSSHESTYLASKTNAIVVVPNYRLGVFGFFVLDHSETPGNTGLLDQTQALKWIQKNIQAFGGDPRKVTIYGESAGSFSISAHVLSPLSKGLFHKAIMSSGAITGYTLYTRSTGEAALTFPIAASLGCNTSSSDAVLSCLRGMNATDVAVAFNTIRAWPIVDGQFFPKQPDSILAASEFNKVPAIIGFNNDDGSTVLENDVKLGRDIYYTGIPASTVPTVINGTFDLVGYVPEELHDQATALAYTYYINDTSDPVTILRSSLDLGRDTFFAAPMIKVAKVMAAADLRVYMYEYAEQVASNFAESPKIAVGARHGDDIPYVFGSILDAGNYPKDNTPEKHQFCNNLIDTWRSFVTANTPVVHTAGGTVNWPRYSEDDPQYTWFKANQTRFLFNPEPKADIVWNILMPTASAVNLACSVTATLFAIFITMML